MEEVLTFTTRSLLALVAVLAAIEFARGRDRVRLDIALMLASLGIPVLLAAAGLNRIGWVQVLAGMAVVAQPYLLVRLVEDFRPVPRAVMIAAAVGMLASWVLLVVFQPARPPSVTLGIIAYFLLFEGYAIIAFFRGAQTAGGVSRWRYGLAGVGSLLLATTILMVGVGTAVPGLQEWLTNIRQALPALAAVAYFLAFVPPLWLRQAWQLPEIRRFLRTVAGQPARERSDRLLRELCTVAGRAAGGLANTVFLWDPDKQVFSAAYSDVPALQSYSVAPAEAPFMTRVWEEGRSGQARSVGELGPGSQKLAQDVNAAAILAVPVATPQRKWGVLVVLQRRGSLFPADDLALLEVLAEQCAIALDNGELVAQQEQRAEEERRLVVQLEAANRELEAFSFSVSHDLRTPLRIIDGFSQALEKEFRDTLGEQGLHYLDRVRTNSQLMGRLIDDLLRLSRVTRSPLTFQEVDLSALARGIADELQRQEPERRAYFHIEDAVKVRGDPGLLEIVLENLLGNAWKFTSKHPVAAIEFGVSHNGASPIYFVRDDGAGFDMEYADKLFGPFQRLHSSQSFDGTGVGLATVQRIISRHGGRLWAEGAVEEGATFYFTLGQ
jgi:signal transduction histidine kinase